MFAQASISAIAAAITCEHARAFSEKATEKIKRMKEKACFELIDPIDKIQQKSKDIDRLKSIGWIMETNLVSKIAL